MLNNVEHPAWRHPTTAQAFDRVLGHFALSFCDVVREISGKLTEMEGKLLSRPSGWVAATRPQYQASLKELRALTEDLSKIRARVTTTNNERRTCQRPMMTEGPTPRMPQRPPKASAVSSRLEEYQQVRGWSEELHRAFCQMCRDHRHHRCLFSLQPQIDLETKSFRFHVALSNSAAGLETEDTDFKSWISVETGAHKGTSRGKEPERNNYFAGTADEAMREGKGAGFGGRRCNPNIKPLDAQIQLCRQISQLSRSCTTRELMGCIEDRLSVYFVPREHIICSDLAGPRSVKAMLQDGQSQTCHLVFNQFERLCLAYQLAIATLFFHSTPWLRSSWNIGQLFLVESANAAHDELVRNFEPCFDITVPSEPAIGSTAKPPGLVDGMSRDQIDYFTAVHNQPMTGKAMGPVYSTIVKQCLKCNFSCQLTDLSENLLQVEIYKDVICKLGTLKNISRSIWA
ncbi:hypothetical protein LTS15_003946 [Exophiala xenobiotica]|nr:hypothetical protein LTS15_003946 [Exophiala xenobiotica]